MGADDGVDCDVKGQDILVTMLDVLLFPVMIPEGQLTGNTGTGCLALWAHDVIPGSGLVLLCWSLLYCSEFTITKGYYGV